ncbi:MAG: ExeA family protein [Terriglobales bacterium]
MYRTFFGLTRSPFEISPDPFFYYGSPRHNEALAAIYYGIRARKGFVVVTGEVGTGKTLLIRRIQGELERGKIEFAYIFNPLLGPDDFLKYIVGDLNLPVPKTKGEALHTLNEYLIARHKKGLTTVLIVDEAQHLSAEVLEEIRLLTNLETTREKLLQIVLLGQPELDEKLDSPNLRQLKQRVAFRCHLEPLTQLECRDYLVRRLQRAGAGVNSWKIFPDPVLAKVFEYSRGIPRLINAIGENALIAAYAKQSKVVTEEIIEEVAADLRLKVTAAAQQASAAAQLAGHDGAVLKKLIELLQLVAAPGASIPQGLQPSSAPPPQETPSTVHPTLTEDKPTKTP